MSIPALYDAHAHLISPDRLRYPRKSLGGMPQRDDPQDMEIEAERFLALMRDHHVRKACAVQRAFVYGYDNRYILDAAARYPDHIVPVLVVDGTDRSTPGLLRQLCERQAVGGIRLSAARPAPFDHDWLCGQQALKTWEVANHMGLPVAVIFFRTHRDRSLPVLGELARRFPRARIVIDHVGVPHGTIFDGPYTAQPESAFPADAGPDFGVDDVLQRLSQEPNIFLKITSINVRRLRQAGIPLQAFTRHLVAVFGASRLMWGSDVGQSAGDYASKVREAHELVQGLEAPDQAAILCGTALGLYG